MLSFLLSSCSWGTRGENRRKLLTKGLFVLSHGVNHFNLFSSVSSEILGVFAMLGSTELALNTAEAQVDVSPALVPLPPRRCRWRAEPKPLASPSAGARTPPRSHPGAWGHSRRCHSPSVSFSWRSALLSCHTATCTQNN